MTQTDAFRYAVDTFTSTLRLVKGISRFGYKATPVDEKSFQNWFSKYSTAGETFIRYWIEYQVNYYNTDAVKAREQKLKASNIILMTWIFGQKAIKRWEKSFKETNSSRVAQNIGQFKEFAKSKLSKFANQAVIELSVGEEHEKRRYLNGKLGLAYCIMQTTLYNHKSTICLSCNYKQHCKEALKDNYPAVYKIRGYDK